MVMDASPKELALDRVGQPGLEPLRRPAASMDEEMEQPGVDEDPQDVRGLVLVEPVAEGRALGEKIAHDVAGADTAFRDDRLEDVADLRIRAGGPANGFTASDAGRNGKGTGSSSPTRATS
jgi:hypothetical protein